MKRKSESNLSITSSKIIFNLKAIAFIIYFSLSSFIFMFLSGCGEKITEQTSEGKPTDSIVPIKLGSNIYSYILNADQVIKPVIAANVYGSQVLVSINKAHTSLIFHRALDSSALFDVNVNIQQTPIAAIAPSKMLFTIYRNQLFFLSTRYGVLYIYNINHNFSIEFYKKIDLSNYLKENSFFIRFIIEQGLQIIDSTAYIPYGKSSSWNHFTDKYCYIKVDLKKKGQGLQKVFETLPEYRKGERHNKDTYIQELKPKDTGIYSFRTYDRIDLFDKNSTVFKRIFFSSNANFLAFDQNKDNDLSYVRRYEQTNETNEAVLTNDRKIIIIKREKKSKLTDTDTYRYIILDATHNFQKIFDRKFDYPIDPYFSFSYKKGFVVFAESLKEAYYYEIP